MYTHNKYPRCYISDTLHELTPRSASQWLTQKPYKNCFLFQKECSQPYNFCREADKVGCKTVHASFILELSYFIPATM